MGNLFMSVVQNINIMRILKIILIVFVVDLIVSISCFFPIRWRDDETDFFIVLPAIIIGNILISALLYYYPTTEFKGLGKGFMANTFIAPILFVLLKLITYDHYQRTSIFKYSFSMNNDRFTLFINNSLDFQILNKEENQEIVYKSGYVILKNDSILLLFGNNNPNFDLNNKQDSSISKIQDTIVLHHDTIWGLGSRPLPVVKL